MVSFPPLGWRAAAGPALALARPLVVAVALALALLVVPARACVCEGMCHVLVLRVSAAWCSAKAPWVAAWAARCCTHPPVRCCPAGGQIQWLRPSPTLVTPTHKTLHIFTLYFTPRFIPHFMPYFTQSSRLTSWPPPPAPPTSCPPPPRPRRPRHHRRRPRHCKHGCEQW